MNKEEAIKIVRSHYPANKQMLNEALEFLIPELKEDENEKIRKEIIAVFKGQIAFTSEEDAKKYIDWLEKQGEQKTIERKEFTSIPFGAFDSELIEETITIPDGCYAYITGNKIYIHKNEQKQDPCKDCDHPMLNCHYFPCTTKKAFEQNNLVTTK